jgi:hypothetical protein
VPLGPSTALEKRADASPGSPVSLLKQRIADVARRRRHSLILVAKPRAIFRPSRLGNWAGRKYAV